MAGDVREADFMARRASADETLVPGWALRATFQLRGLELVGAQARRTVLQLGGIALILWFVVSVVEGPLATPAAITSIGGTLCRYWRHVS